MSRSSTIVCSFLLLSGRFKKADEAILYVQKCHKKAYPNPSFRSQLKSLKSTNSNENEEVKEDLDVEKMSPKNKEQEHISAAVA